MSNAAQHRLTVGQLAGRLLIVLLSLALTVVLVAHRSFPERGGLGLFFDNLAPWLGLGIPVLLLLALLIRGRISFLILLLPAIAWAWIFGAAFLPANPPEPVSKFTVATQNVHEHEGAAVSSAQGLAAEGADLISLQELGEGQAEQVGQLLAASHPYQFSVGTVGVYSKHPILDKQPLDLGLSWSRAAKLRIQTDTEEVTVYAVHAASARPLEHGERDLMLRNLGQIMDMDQSSKIIALGDFNATSTDRHFSPITDQLDEVPHESWGFGMTWPNRPLAVLRIDHVLVRGLDTGSASTLSIGNSDHRAVLATLDLASK